MLGHYSTCAIERDSNVSASKDRDAAVVPYQIDCHTTKKGKLIAGTKRRICWKFGFSNCDAVRRGLSGTDCRGEEHEVVFVWSLTSGKKFVLADGHEVHWSKESPISDKFDGSWHCSWQSQMAGANRELKVVAHSSSPLFERKNVNKNSLVADSSFRKFDLLIDGVSFSNMAQMFELGIAKTAKDRKRISMGDLDSLWGNTVHVQQRQPQRRSQIHDFEVDCISSHSFQPDLISVESEHHQSTHMPRKAQQPPHTPFLQSLSESMQHTQPQYLQQQHPPLAPPFQSLSQSMPDIRYNFSPSSTSISVPNWNQQFAQSQQCLQQPVQIPSQNSPTSVVQLTAGNPFDVYATAALKPHEQQNIYAQPNNNYYVHQPQQRRESSPVY